MVGLYEGGNEPPGSLKTSKEVQTAVTHWFQSQTAGHRAMKVDPAPPLPPTIEDLGVRITKAFALVDGPMLQRVWQEIYYRLNVCPVTQGAHIEYM
ncbi:hypothetical protein ANN_17137 [Periplaneta americana]|uniref:Uncharacterized protein n=1 Tax=Periplaneta americana TaxID=6978 RepID=A0ABQ8SS32_PERAM|nr:hypothetical protein ANN_17137 [Periplaneta americana]